MNRYLFTKLDSKIIRQFELTNPIWQDNHTGMPQDDDIQYLLTSLLTVEKFGFDFTSEQVAETWLDSIPILHLCTAERVAYRNFVNGFLPPESAVICNPYREWIGAQIRGDFFGYISPGNPHQAAYLAWNDARVSHVKNGIYGSIWVATMISCAFTPLSFVELIETALSYVPQFSRFYKFVTSIVLRYYRGESHEQAVQNIHATFSEKNIHHWCHTIPNAMLVACALLWGEGNFGRSIGLAVESGFDTDCNAATVGSILGVYHGTSCISEHWTCVLQNKIFSSVREMHGVRVSECAKRTAMLARSPKTLSNQF